MCDCGHGVKSDIWTLCVGRQRYAAHGLNGVLCQLGEIACCSDPIRTIEVDHDDQAVYVYFHDVDGGNF